MLKPVEQQLEKMGSDIAKPVEKMLEMKTFYIVKFVEQRLEKMGSDIAKPVEKILLMKALNIVKIVKLLLEKMGSDIANLVMDYNTKVVFVIQLQAKMRSAIVKVLKLLGMRESGIRLIVLRFKEMTT